MRNFNSRNKKAKTVWETWRSHGENEPSSEAIVHWVAGESPHRWTWEELLKAASKVAWQLCDSGVKKGDVCALIIRHHKEFYPIYLGIESIGAIPSVLAYPNNRIHPEKFRQGLEGMARRSGLDWILTERELEGVIRPLIHGPHSTIRNILFPTEWSLDSTRSKDFPSCGNIRPEESCLLQHSSGTTGLQKAVVLSHKAVLKHIEYYGQSIAVTPDDRIVSWLPLYHDMGLIAAFYLALTLRIPLVQLDPFEWVSAPVIFLNAMMEEKGTLAWLPNFSYNLMADRIREEDLEGFRLDSVRMLINCSEPVRAESHEKFYRRFSRYGLKKEALAACYAMAETTFAVTQSPPGKEARVIDVNREELAKGYVKPIVEGEETRSCTSSGLPISECDLRVVNESGKSLPEGQVGELVIRSVSMFDEYKNNPEKTVEVLKDGWYYSGDYGFCYEGEYYIIGRKKDIIIFAGKNIYPEDIEDTVGQVPGVIPGRVVAFGYEDEVTGTEQIFVVSETAVVGESERKSLRMAIIQAGMGMDVTISKVYLVDPRWLIKSSSGKPSRKANKERALNGIG